MLHTVTSLCLLTSVPQYGGDSGSRSGASGRRRGGEGSSFGCAGGDPGGAEDRTDCTSSDSLRSLRGSLPGVKPEECVRVTCPGVVLGEGTEEQW